MQFAGLGQILMRVGESAEPESPGQPLQGAIATSTNSLCVALTTSACASRRNVAKSSTDAVAPRTSSASVAAVRRLVGVGPLRREPDREWLQRPAQFEQF